MAGGINGAQHSWTLMNGSNVNNRPGASETGSVPGNGIYDKIMVIPHHNPDSKDADAKMANFPSRGFWFLRWLFV